MPAILIAGKDWTSRALLRAQLIEEGFDAEGYDNVGDAVERLRTSRTLPALLVADFFESEKPVEEIATLSHWAKILPIWIMTSHGAGGGESLENRGFERVLFRPLDVGKLVREIKARLAG